MNELTIHGNITAEPQIGYSANGTPYLKFSVAVNNRRYDRESGRWSDTAPVYHRVVAFNTLAENAANLTKGTTVTITGELADDSWDLEDGKRQYRTQLVAADIAVSLRFATATVTKNPRRPASNDNATEVPAARTQPAVKELATPGTRD
jgi:single-strand DNA-binding protein